MPTSIDSAQITILEKQVKCEYFTILQQGEQIWYQKSHDKWFFHGDYNTQYLHSQAIIHNQHSSIKGLFMEGHWLTDNDILCSHVVEHLQERYTVQPTDRITASSLPPLCHFSNLESSDLAR